MKIQVSVYFNTTFWNFRGRRVKKTKRLYVVLSYQVLCVRILKFSILLLQPEKHQWKNAPQYFSAHRLNVNFLKTVFLKSSLCFSYNSNSSGQDKEESKFGNNINRLRWPYWIYGRTNYKRTIFCRKIIFAVRFADVDQLW